MIQNIIIAASCLVLSGLLNAQTGTRINKLTLEYDLSVHQGEIRITSKETVDKEIISVSSSNNFEVKESVMTDEFTILDNIDAYTLVPKENGNYKKLKVKSVSEEDYISRGVFYQENKRSIITFPGIEEGAILHSEVRLTHKMPQFLPPFYFDNYLECEMMELIIRADKEIDLNFIERYYGAENNITKEENTDERRVVYHWVAKGLEKREYEDNSGGVSCYAPHLIFHIKSYKYNNEEYHVLRNKNDLFKWYSGLIKDYDLSKNYTHVLDSLKSHSNSDIELAENIFNWVQHRVNYVAYEDGMGGFIPRKPDFVLENRYGDCKDMATLTKTMMNKCGLDCYVAFVGTRDKCYTYDDCPTPYADNHMIAVYPSDTGFIFIDPTSIFSQFGVPSSFIQGKEAMIRLTPEEYKVVRIPFMSPETSVIKDQFQIRLDGEKVTGDGVSRLSGYDKVEYEYALRYKSVSEKELFAEYNDVGNESFTVDQLLHQNNGSNKGELTSKYEFEILNYMNSHNGVTYLNPFLKKVALIDLNNRQLDYQIDHKYRHEVEVVIHLGDDAIVTNSIQDEVLSENDLSLEIHVEKMGNDILISYAFTCDRSDVSVEDIPSVKSTIRKIKRKLKQQIEIKYED